MNTPYYIIFLAIVIANSVFNDEFILYFSCSFFFADGVPQALPEHRIRSLFVLAIKRANDKANRPLPISLLPDSGFLRQLRLPSLPLRLFCRFYRCLP